MLMSFKNGAPQSAGKRLFAVFSFVCGVFFFSCGLDEVISVAEPTKTNNDPNYSGVDFLKWYCSFVTEERGNSDTKGFSGTDIYYKIYNSSSALESQRSSILSVNTTSNGTASATKMIEPYSYQPLGLSSGSPESPFIPDDGKNRSVVFRAKTYSGNENYAGDNMEQFRACVIIDGQVMSSGDGVPLVPFRNGSTKSFDFFDDNGDDSDSDVKPAEGDSDFYYSSSSSADDTYYVQFFAVGVAFDEATLSNTYSLVLDLGSVPIIKGS